MDIPNFLASGAGFASSGSALDAAGKASRQLQGASQFQAKLLGSEKGGEGPKLAGAEVPADEDLRKAFQDFVGQTFFSQMISSMRSTQQEAAYFNGGRAEKIFQGQLDQILSEELSNASAAQISDPMFKLFQLRRQ
jgi:flagellar protein FlgJ